ncbi:MAG: hypothetical protein JRG91_09925 [Deltaproteobacteria bacterium]|nr:hypothetical protein [Deltaproteobacteria bacterium]
MATRIHRLLWSVLCGTALGLGSAGCYESDPPEDASADTDSDAVEDAVEAVGDPETEWDTLYGAPAYGPEPSP